VHMVEIFNKSSQITKWINAVAGYMLKEALSGKDWPGLKLVEGRSVRKWRDEHEVMELLSEYDDTQILNVKLKGIGDIEKLLGKKQFAEALNDVIIKPEGSPTLVNKSDPRQELNNAENDFKDL